MRGVRGDTVIRWRDFLSAAAKSGCSAALSLTLYD
jgi:hypothetical protein